MLLGVDLLHREVGALDDAHLDRRTACGDSTDCPLPEALDHVVGVGEIGLQHDARRHATVRRLVEHAHERLDGQLEVGVLLHVEVDERRRRRRDGGVVDAPQGGADALDGVLERVHVEQGADRRDLHGDVVDVGTLQRGDHPRDALLCLGVGEDRLAEDVEVERDAFTACAWRCGG